MTPQEALARIIDYHEIPHDDMVCLMRSIMSGQVSPVMIAALITALRVKGETIGEITAAAYVMRELSTKVDVTDTTHLVDTCGTGGDTAHTFNISTAAAFVAAAAGVKVAKHGGRAVSSQSGSADVLEALGANINLTPSQVSYAIACVGLGFMFAPHHHSAMKHAAPVRKELGMRTLFNLLGPLTNPAGAPQQVMGVFRPDLVATQAHVLHNLGSQRALIVHGLEGLDEISISGETLVGELRDGQIQTYKIHPEQFNLPIHDIQSIKVASIEESKNTLIAALKGTHPAARDIVALNAGASIYLAGLTPSLFEGVQRALECIRSGAAEQKLQQFIDCTTLAPEYIL